MTGAPVPAGACAPPEDPAGSAFLPAFCGGEQIVLVLSRSVPPLLRNKSSISQYSYFVEEMFMRKRKRHPTEKHNYLFSRFCLGLSRGETCVPARARPVSYTHLDVYKRQIHMSKFIEVKNGFSNPTPNSAALILNPIIKCSIQPRWNFVCSTSIKHQPAYSIYIRC